MILRWYYLLFSVICPALLSLPAQSAQLQYQTPVTLSTGAVHADSVAVGDFDGDGKLDLAITDGHLKTVSVYLNQGDGAFTAPPVVTTLAIDNTAGAMVAGEFNGDGKADLVVATIAAPNQNSLVLLATGGGHFAVQPPLPGSFGFESAKLADFNGDGHTDIFFGGNGEPYLYLGKGDGTFVQQSVPNGSFPGFYTSVTAGAFTASGHVDAVAVDYGDPPFTSGSIDFFPGNGDGTLQTPTSYKPSSIYGPSTIDAADFNHDGKLDLLLGSASGAAIALGNGDGTFQFGADQLIQLYSLLGQGSSTNPDISTAAAADLNGDGKSDAIILDQTKGLLSLVVNDGTGRFPDALSTPFTYQLAAPYTTTFYNLTVADLNGDGLSDVIAVGASTNTITLLLSGRAVTPSSISLVGSGNSLLVGSNLQFTAKVSGGSVAPTGMVTLLDGTTQLGQQPLDASGAASFSLASLSAGPHSLAASYPGDAVYGASTSPALNQVVTDFMPSLTTATQTVAAGSSASYNLVIAPVAGFNGSVTFTCSGLPSYASCSAPPTNVAGSSATATITVATASNALAETGRTGSFLYACVLGGGFWLLRRRTGGGADRLLRAFLSSTAAVGGRSRRLRRLVEGSAISSSAAHQPDVYVYDPGHRNPEWSDGHAFRGRHLDHSLLKWKRAIAFQSLGRHAILSPRHQPAYSGWVDPKEPRHAEALSEQ